MARTRTRRVYIGGQPWTVRYECLLRDADGECDYGNHEIRLRKGLHGIDLFDTILHECIHARWPDLHEDAVADFSETITGFMGREFPHLDDHGEE